MKKILKSFYNSFCNLIDTPAVILLYHRVTDLPQDPQQLAVSPENFDAHIDVLRKKYFLIDIDEFVEIVKKKKKMPGKAVVITFDDGYADNFQEALPVLENRNAQALFYITTSKINTPWELWWDDLERIFLADHILPLLLRVTINVKEYTFDTSAPQARISAYHALHPLIKDCNTPKRESAMDSIITWSGHSKTGRKTHRMMSFDQLIQLSKSRAAVIGAHTHTHPKLSACSHAEQYNDILISKEKLEGLTGRAIKHFSYPFGTRSDYNHDSVAICKELGFDMVCANYHNQVHRWHSRFELPRTLVRNWDATEFEGRMENFFKA